MSTRKNNRSSSTKSNIGGRESNHNATASPDRNARGRTERGGADPKAGHIHNQKTQRLPRVDAPESGTSPGKRTSPHPRATHGKKTRLPAFLEILLSLYVILKSGVVSLTAGIRHRMRATGERSSRPRTSLFAQNKGFLIIIAGILILSAVIYGTVWLFTHKNAMVVYMNGEEVGIVAYEKTLTADSIQKTAEAKLKSSIGGVNVEVSDVITTELVHASGDERISMDSLLEKLYTNFSYKVEACAISVNGTEMAVVKTLGDATAIQDAIKKTYYQEHLNITGATFVEDVRNTLKFVDDSDIMTNQKAAEILSKNLDAEVMYEVKQGDVLGAIASDNGMTVDEILKINPGLDPAAFLQIGQQLVLSVPKPLLSVRTAERVTYTTVAPKTTEKRENPNEYKTYSKVIQQGKDGQKEVTEDIIRVNGTETERIPVSEKILVEPIVEIVEVGTNDVPPRRALGSFIWPARGRLTDDFGSRRGKHAGLDIAGFYGAPVYASDGGTVVKAEWFNGYGNLVIIDHGNGFETYYGHNSEILVSVGQQVAQGEILAKMGSTGNSSGDHCHFEIHVNGVAKNPLDYLN